MEKKNFVPERKAYLAPSAKAHFIAVEESVMSPVEGAPGDDNTYQDYNYS